MADFLWEDAFVTKLYSEGEYDLDILRSYIDKYGVNAIDRGAGTIFDGIYLWQKIIRTGAVDLIFEYKPSFPLYNGVYVSNYNWVEAYDCYIWGKFLEQDTGYHLIRRPLQYFLKKYPNFMCFMDKYYGKYRKRGWIVRRSRDSFIGKFNNHFNKGITFFEIMKHMIFE